MKEKKGFLIHTLIGGILAISLIGCSPGGNRTPASPAPTHEMSTSTPAGDDTTAAPKATETPVAGNHITVEGQVSMDFDASTTTAVTLIDTVTVTLLDTDNATGVMIFLPSGIQPGTYDIGGEDAEVTARFDSLQDTTISSYESTSGTLTLTQVDGTYSGTFTFEASNGTDTITVTGSLDGVTSAGV
jgi:hypothetical protein